MPPTGWSKARRAASYQAPPPSRVRVYAGYVFNRWSFTAVAFMALGVFLTLTYFWFEFSDRIDQRLLSGEVYTASAGIYSALKTLKVGEATTMPSVYRVSEVRRLYRAQ